MTDRKTQRLFFALWPDPPVRRRLAEAVAGLATGARGRRVPAERLHITLLFLGNVTAETRGAIESAVDSVAAAPFEIVLERFGFWPKAGVVWFGPRSVPAELLRLYQGLAAAVASCGATFETRPYQPHLTVIRDARFPPAEKPPVPVPWPVESFALVASENAVGGAHYRVLRSWPLAAAGPAGSRC